MVVDANYTRDLSNMTSRMLAVADVLTAAEGWPGAYAGVNSAASVPHTGGRARNGERGERARDAKGAISHSPSYSATCERHILATSYRRDRARSHEVRSSSVAVILLTYLRFRKALSREQLAALPIRMPFHRAAAWFGLISIAAIAATTFFVDGLEYSVLFYLRS
jgi:hypothetical protein